MTLRQEMPYVFIEITGFPGISELLEIQRFRLALTYLHATEVCPAIQQDLAARKLTINRAVSSRIITAHFELTNAFREAVGHPALDGRIGAQLDHGGQRKPVAVSHTILYVNSCITT